VLLLLLLVVVVVVLLLVLLLLLQELVQVNVLRGARNLLSNAVPIGRATLPLAQVRL
jgi:hypothetical protein